MSDPGRCLSARDLGARQSEPRERVHPSPRLRRSEDVKSIAYDVLRHRVLVTFEAEADGIDSEQIVKKILERVEFQ